ncbi:hypothetical protein [Nonomuraea candida]|uniref:hypothetical protein n=1 Tax=Nonomuraea candida TaxID=359159 RepID=UPI000A931036|nr:hypothetical protein [Nonomuraea candida]
MPDGFDTRETWPFQCLRCLHVWEEDFVVRSLTDAYGNEGHIWLSSGVPVPPPWSGACCPCCGAYGVTWFPSGYSTRHPELVPALDPEPAPVFVPAPAPLPVRSPAVARTHLPGRLLVALGVPLALFVGYELYTSVVAVARPHP